MRWMMFWIVLFCLPVQAVTVEVVGSAVLSNSLNQSRDQALQDAMRQASLQAGARVRSAQLMNRGVVDSDQVSIEATGELRNVEILWEDQRNGLYEVAIRADARPAAMCRLSKQHYRKVIAVAGFALVHPVQASAGRLENIEQALPRELTASLNDKANVRALDASGIGLFRDHQRAPAQNTHQHRLTTSVTLATRLGAQYVISGVIRNLSVAGLRKTAGHASDDSWRSLLGLRRTVVQRDFAMDVFVHDGLSGALLFQREYRISAPWSQKTGQHVGFGSARFWQGEYGQAVRGVMDQAVDDLTEVIRCQPFMARIVRADGKRLHIEAPAAAGIRPGDKFQVYRTGTFYNLDLEPRTELTDMSTEAVVRQVQPQFVVAELPGSASHLAIQRDDLVIAW